MNSFIGNHIHFIAHWGQWVALGIGVVAALLIYRGVRGNRWLLPRGLLGWSGVLLLSLLTIFCGLVFARITVIKPGALEILERLDSIKGRRAPALDYQLVSDGSAESVTDLRGRVVLVNFWATWCLPCRHELPDLDRLQRQHAATDLTVLTVSDESREVLLAHDAEFNYTMRNGYLTEFPWIDMGSERPITFLLDRDGVVREYFTGPWDYDHFSKKLEPYL